MEADFRISRHVARLRRSCIALQQLRVECSDRYGATLDIVDGADHKNMLQAMSSKLSPLGIELGNVGVYSQYENGRGCP